MLFFFSFTTHRNFEIYTQCYKLIPQGICGNPWPMLNTAVESLGYHKDTLAEECPFEYHLFGVDPEDCSRFYSCIEGNIINAFRVKSRIFTSLKNPETHAWCYFFFFPQDDCIMVIADATGTST